MESCKFACFKKVNMLDDIFSEANYCIFIAEILTGDLDTYRRQENPL